MKYNVKPLFSRYSKYHKTLSICAMPHEEKHSEEALCGNGLIVVNEVHVVYNHVGQTSLDEQAQE